MALRHTRGAVLPLRQASLLLLLLLLPWRRSTLLQPLGRWGARRLALWLPLPRHRRTRRGWWGLCLLRWCTALLRLRHEPLRRCVPVPLLLLLTEGPHAL